MDALQPYVLEKCTLLEFAQYLLDNHSAASWLVVCSTREAFEERLGAELVAKQSGLYGMTMHSPPTLRMLAACRTLRVAFTPDLVRLRAFLASIKSTTDHPAGEFSILAILDPIAVHQPTTSYSAQGFNRTFALAIDVATTLRARLIINESILPSTEDDTELLDPWDANVGIVDVRTKTFGPGSRGWVGRTIKLRHIAERWMSFKQIESHV